MAKYRSYLPMSKVSSRISLAEIDSKGTSQGRRKKSYNLSNWFDKLEAAEMINSSYFEVMEEDEDDLDEDDQVTNVIKLFCP
jgi:hypothetical protein